MRVCTDNACGESKSQNFHKRLLALSFLIAATAPQAPMYCYCISRQRLTMIAMELCRLSVCLALRYACRWCACGTATSEPSRGGINPSMPCESVRKLRPKRHHRASLAHRKRRQEGG